VHQSEVKLTAVTAPNLSWRQRCGALPLTDLSSSGATLRGGDADHERL